SAVASADSATSTPPVAPNSSASASFRALTSTAMIVPAPTVAAARIADRPTPPQPITATRSPGRTPAVRQTAPTPVVTAQPTRPATSNGTPRGIGTQERSGSTHASANEEMNE